MTNITAETPNSESALLQHPDSDAHLAQLTSQLESANQRIGQLTSENEKLKAVKEQEDSDEKIIRYKMSIGISRAQAVAVIRRQREAHRLDPHRALSVEASHELALQQNHRFR
ncbi:MAG TPA: hypothetical protein VGO67_05440 [Verrucomicrobiae bacterium]|jgi:hypothetical protein